jgi:hypothetical protein
VTELSQQHPTRVTATSPSVFHRERGLGPLAVSRCDLRSTTRVAVTTWGAGEEKWQILADASRGEADVAAYGLEGPGVGARDLDKAGAGRVFLAGPPSSSPTPCWQSCPHRSDERGTGRRPGLFLFSSRSTIGTMVDIRSRAVLLGALLWAACGRTGMESVTSSSSVYEHPRQPSLAAGSDHFTYYEGAPGQNACARDQDCVISGCSDSTCAAEVIAIADEEFCENLLRTSVVEPPFSRCGCLAGECRWYFESDYDRTCDSDSDCAGLGPPPEGVLKKASWTCVGGRCQF